MPSVDLRAREDVSRPYINEELSRLRGSTQVDVRVTRNQPKNKRMGKWVPASSPYPPAKRVTQQARVAGLDSSP